MTQSDESLFSVDLSSGHKLRFASIGEVERWISDQRSDWSWLLDNPPLPMGPELDELRGKYIQCFSKLSTSLSQWKQAPGEANRAQNLRNMFANNYSSGSQVLLGDHEWAIISREVAKSSGQLAGAASLAYLLKIPLHIVPINNIGVIVGVTQAILARDGISGNSPNIVAQSIQRFVGDNQEKLDKQSTQFQEHKIAAETFLNDSKTEFDEQKNNRTKTWDESIARIEQEFQNAVSSIKGTEAAYIKQMQLQASVSYWRGQAALQQKSSRIYLFVLLAVIAAVLIFGFFAIRAYVPFLLSKNITAEPAIYAVYLTMTLLITTVVFWAARVIVRLYLSAHHLSIDAQERVVMIQTYLALLKEGKLDPGERAIVLAPLFRSSADGIVRDEGAPDLSVAALVSRLLDKH